MIRTLTIYPKSRDELREWLMANAATEHEVWVHCIRRKHDTILPYVELVEEALCFGWIDSTLHSNPNGEGEGERQWLSPIAKRRSGGGTPPTRRGERALARYVVSRDALLGGSRSFQSDGRTLRDGTQYRALQKDDC